ncbi:hypothetical protein Tco_0040001 [Tanacetum coccineum]
MKCCLVNLGKADEGFIVGYAVYSRLIRVYIYPAKSRRGTLHLRYIEDKPNIQGAGHEWYFDLDYLTDTLGYTHFKANQPAGAQDCSIYAGTEVKDTSGMKMTDSGYVEELAMLQRQEHEAKDAAEKLGFDVPLPAGNVIPAVSASLPPCQSLGSNEHSTRYLAPSDLGNSHSSSSIDIHHPPSTGIFSSSSYDDDFGADANNLAPTVDVNPIATTR